MGLWQRIKTILLGAGHKAVEAAENPELVLTGKIAEATADYEKAQKVLAGCKAQQAAMYRSLEAKETECARWKDIARKALAAENTKDAEDAYTKFKTLEGTIAQLSAEFEDLEKVYAEQEESLKELRDQLLDFNSQKESILLQKKMNDARTTIQGVSMSGGTSAQETLDRMREKVLVSRDVLDAQSKLQSSLKEDRFAKYEKAAPSLEDMRKDLE